jgi:hypothetical protein
LALGPGIVTRRPLILQLVYSPSRWKKTRKSESDGSGDESPDLEEAEPEEWGKFSHIKDKVRKFKSSGLRGKYYLKITSKTLNFVGKLVEGPSHQGRIHDFSYVSQSFRMYNLVLRARMREAPRGVCPPGILYF